MRSLAWTMTVLALGAICSCSGGSSTKVLYAVGNSPDVTIFAVSGSGRLIGVGNGDPSDHAPDKGVVRRAFNGRCVAIVQAGKTPGDLRIEASADAIAGAVTTVACRAATPRPSL